MNLVFFYDTSNCLDVREPLHLIHRDTQRLTEIPYQRITLVPRPGTGVPTRRALRPFAAHMEVASEYPFLDHLRTAPY